MLSSFSFVRLGGQALAQAQVRVLAVGQEYCQTHCMTFEDLLRQPDRQAMFSGYRQCGGAELAGRSRMYSDETEIVREEDRMQMDLEMFEGRSPGCLREGMIDARR